MPSASPVGRLELIGGWLMLSEAPNNLSVLVVRPQRLGYPLVSFTLATAPFSRLFFLHCP